MKIAVFHNLPLGGARRTLYEQIKNLSKRHTIDLYEIGYENHLLEANEFVKFRKKYDFTLENNIPGIFNRLIKDYRNFISLRNLQRKIAGEIDSKNYDICLVHSDIYTESPFILRYLKTPSVYHCHELLRLVYEKHLRFYEKVGYHKRIYELIVRKIKKRVDRVNAQSAKFILTSSYYIAEKAKRVYKKKAYTCHPGVDIKLFSKRTNKVGNYVLFVGGKSKLKGYNLAKKAISISRKKFNIDLIILGFGKGDLLIKNDKKLSKLYSEALATFCPAHEEPLGLVALESMACETPVLAVNEGGYKETVVDGKTGYLLPRKAEKFSDKLLFLYSNKNKRNKMGKDARAHVIKNFTWERHGRCMEKYLEEIVYGNK